jgi:hypothetical protein
VSSPHLVRRQVSGEEAGKAEADPALCHAEHVDGGTVVGSRLDGLRPDAGTFAERRGEQRQRALVVHALQQGLVDLAFAVGCGLDAVGHAGVHALCGHVRADEDGLATVADAARRQHNGDGERNCDCAQWSHVGVQLDAFR